MPTALRTFRLLCCALLLLCIVCAAAPDLDIMIRSVQRQDELTHEPPAYEAATPIAFKTKIVTVTQIVSANPQPTTPAGTPLAKGDQQPGSVSNSTRSWKALVALPWSISRALATTSFSYLLWPVWTMALWAVRVLVYRPAVFIYLFCLEKPLKALVSIFLWILPTVAFMMATAIIGTLIGGTTGWVSGIVTSTLQSAVSGEKKGGKTADGKRRIEYPEKPRRVTSARSASEPSQMPVIPGIKPMKHINIKSRRYADIKSSKEEWSRRRQGTPPK